MDEQLFVDFLKCLLNFTEQLEADNVSNGGRRCSESVGSRDSLAMATFRSDCAQRSATRVLLFLLGDNNTDKETETNGTGMPMSSCTARHTWDKCGITMV